MAWNDRIDPITKQPGKHDGVDLPFGMNAPLLAMAGGTLVNVANDPKGYGWYADVKHDDGTMGRYAHANVIGKPLGSRIEPGEELGLVGSTGRSTGPHVHFELHKDGSPVDPRGFVNMAKQMSPNSKGGSMSNFPLTTGQAPQLSNFDALMQQAMNNSVNAKVDPRLAQAMAENAQSRSANLPLALGAMLSRDQGVQQFGDSIYKDANAARGLIPLGEEGFVNGSNGEFYESPVAKDKRQQRMLELALRQASENERKQASVLLQTQQQQVNEYVKRMGIQNQEILAGIAQQNADSKTTTANAAEATAKAKVDAAALGRPLPFGKLVELSGKGDVVDKLDTLYGDYQNGYSGSSPSKVAGEFENWWGRSMPSSDSLEKQATWWQSYNNHINLVRKELFGTALTAPEKAAFDAANISMGMKDSVIRENLAKQQIAAAAAYNKIISHGKAGGYNMGDFEPKGEMPLPSAGSGQVGNGPTAAAPSAGTKPPPPKAVEFLRANPTPENIAAFKAKFGRLPEGM